MKISPSLLSANFCNLERDLKLLENAGADFVHLDVMDGIFVPNISFGVPVIKSIKKCTSLPFDVHLMIENPIEYVSAFASAGADIITFHVESKSNVMETIKKIKECKVAAGLSIKPNTKVKEVYSYLRYVDLVLVMSVEPGFGGQKFMPIATSKIAELKKVLKEQKLSTLIEVDGGMNEETIREVKKAGADIVVAGDAIFKSLNINQTIKDFKNL